MTDFKPGQQVVATVTRNGQISRHHGLFIRTDETPKGPWHVMQPTNTEEPVRKVRPANLSAL